MNHRNRPINIFMLSPEDYAGSGCRIRDAVRSVSNKAKIDIHLITWKRRNIGFNDADIVLSDGTQALEKAQHLLNKADIVHFKDDNPPIDGMYGLHLPPKAKIVHTAGGSGFRRRILPPITEECIARKVELPLDDIGDSQATWWMVHDDESLVWASDKRELELNLMSYIGEKHVNLLSCPVTEIKGPIVIRGEVVLHQTEDNAGFKICTIIAEHLNDEGTVTGKTIRRFGALRGKKLPWCVVFHPKKGQHSMRFSISSMRTDRAQFTLNNFEFLEMHNTWYNNSVSEEIEQASMGLWPLETYRDADLRTALTADLLIEEDMVFTPQAIPTSEFHPEIKPKERLIVTHAPSNRMKKGTDSIVLPTLKLLSERFNLDIRLIEGMSHKKCLETLQESDLYVELGLGGFYGNAVMEAMAFGIPVAVHIRDKVIKQAGDSFEDCPIIPVEQRTIDAFTKILEPWLENPKALRLQGLKSRKWICRIHDEKVVGRKWIQLYRDLAIPISSFYRLFCKKLRTPISKEQEDMRTIYDYREKPKTI